MVRRSARRPSLATVAERVGVSKATVSNSFNRPELVSAEVLARVLAEAERQNFTGPDPAARQLSRGRTDTLGLLFTDELSVAFGDPAAVAFIKGLAMSCESAGLNMLLVSTESTGGRSSAVGNAVVDGFVVYSVPADDPHLQRVLDRRLPTVVVDSPPDVPGVDWVGPDDRAGARALGALLVGLGHRRIGVITGTGRDYSGRADVSIIGSEPASVHRNRVLGLQDALTEVGHRRSTHRGPSREQCAGRCGGAARAAGPTAGPDCRVRVDGRARARCPAGGRERGLSVPDRVDDHRVRRHPGSGRGRSDHGQPALDRQGPDRR